MTSPQPAPETPNVPADPMMSSNQLEGSIGAEMSDQARTLAMALLKEDQVGAEILKGVVTAVALTGSPPTITINLSGDSSVAIAGVRMLDSYSPVVGDTVLVVKQGADLFALGQMNSTTAAPSENGWVTPSLGTNVTTHAIDPVRYRVVVRDGDRVVQLRGGVNIASSATALWTMPSDVRPVVNLLPLLCARNTDGGSNVAQLQVNSNGTMVLAGATTTGANASPNTDSTASGDRTSGALPDSTTDNSSVLTTSTHSGHQHWLSDWLGGPPKDFTPDPANGSHSHTVPAHSHGFGHDHSFIHSHTVNAHSHAVAHPTWLSFNGIEYIL